jgi:S-DNA-T family DNA segregation ATPase FtsK/SpoIIIE
MLASPPRRSVSGPRAPEIVPPRRFPLVATIAPVVASLVLFAVTRSPFTLVFALLGPVVAVGTVADSALQRRRSRGREAKRFSDELDRAREQIDTAHVAERADLDHQAPRAHQLLGDERRTLIGWRAAASAAIGGPNRASTLIRLGSGEVPASVTLEGSNSTSGAEPDARLASLHSHAASLTGAPITADLDAGIGLIGPVVQVRAAVRGILLQLATLRSPETTMITAPADPAWDWLVGLPHSTNQSGPSGRVDVVGGGESLAIAFAASVATLPHEIGAVLEIAATGNARLVIGGAMTAEPQFRPEFVGLEVATEAALSLGRLAALNGVPAGRASVVPDSVELETLEQTEETGRLSATVGTAADGPFVLDLVCDGPHAIVGGTTGSGKSELLVTWVLAMAAKRSPAEVTFLFVDFKGGAAFDALSRLPHCVGVITDLDVEHSLRALVSLGAELRHRERMLAGNGLRSIDDRVDDPPFPRLVVIVDEYAALVEAHSSLHSVFADIAARGRSLGVHLVLCTQRPAGVVRDGILANCALRISLRVLTAADSTAVLGTDGAATLGSAPLGRALVGGGGAAIPVQIARSRDADRDRVAERWASIEQPRVPWLPPLSSRISVESIAETPPDDGIPFAMEDQPELQAQEPARYRPEVHGSLLIVGAAGSGKSGALAALAAAPSRIVVEYLPRALPQLWDALAAAISAPPSRDRVLLLDDLDILIGTADDSYQPALLDQLTRLLREGRASGTHLVVTVQRVTGALQSMVALCGSVLVLRMPNRQEHVLAGGAAGDFRDDLPPGAGSWRGHRVQVFDAPRPEPSSAALLATDLDLTTTRVAIVSTRPEQLAQQMRLTAPLRNIVVLGARHPEPSGGGVQTSAAHDPEILVADPETWQSQWSTFVAVQRSCDLLFDGCSLAELRTLTRSRDLPPPFPRGERPLWLWRRGAEITRVRLRG